MSLTRLMRGMGAPALMIQPTQELKMKKSTARVAPTPKSDFQKDQAFEERATKIELTWGTLYVTDGEIVLCSYLNREPMKVETTSGGNRIVLRRPKKI